MTTEKPTIVSALGAIPKPDSVKIRLIPDCSRPQHSNVNSYTATQRYSYMTVDKAVSLIKTNAYLAKIDLKSANRQCLFLRQTTLLLVLQGDFVDKTLIYLYDCKLPFGASKSPEIFHRLTQAITQMLKQRGFTVLAYLDDFLIISDTVVQCQVAYQALPKLLRELGFQINWDKAVGPLSAIDISRQPRSQGSLLPALRSERETDPGKRLVTWLQNKINFEGGVLCHIFLSGLFATFTQ